MSHIELVHLSKTYPSGTQALSDVTLGVAPGELLVLAGPSGCGKTTLLRLVAGLESPTSGDIRFAGQSVLQLPPDRRNVGMVFQSSALYPHLSVRKNMEFGLKSQRLPRDEVQQRVGQTADWLRIAPLLDRRPDELSGGEAQRVAIGRAVVRRPRVLLLDEPLSSLDAQLRSELRLELARLHRELEATIIYVTHDQAEAMTLADRIAVIDQGRIQQVGAPQQVYDAPANRMVASFIGSPPMNLVDGTIEQGVFRSGALAWPVSGAADGPATLGIRPEQLRIAGPDEAPLTTGVVERVEYLGHARIVYLRCGETLLAMRTGLQATALPGESLRLAIDGYWLGE